MKTTLFITAIFCIAAHTTTAQVEVGNIDEPKLSDRQQNRFDQLFFKAAEQRATGDYTAAIETYHQSLKIEPRNVAVNFALGELYLEDNELKLAEEHLTKAHQGEPDNPWVLRALWEYYRHVEDLPGQIETLESLRELRPNNPEYMYEMAHARLMMNDGKGAIRALNDLESVMGVDDVIIDQKVRIYMQMDDPEAAEEELRSLADKYPDYVEYRGRLAEFLSGAGREEDALREYRRIMRIDPREPRAHLYMAERQRQLDHVDSSLYHLGIALGSPRMDIDPKIAVMSSFYLLVEQDPLFSDVAFEFLDTIIFTHPSDPRGYALKADFTIRENRIEESRSLWKTATSLPEGNKWEIWQQILQCDIILEDWDSLFADSERVLEIFPNQPAGYLFNGMALTQLSRNRDAQEVLEAGMLYAGRQQQVREQFWIQLATVHHNLGEGEDSDGYMDLALQVNPDNDLALNNYAYYLAERGERLDDALEMIGKALERSPHQSTYWDTYAWVLYKQKKYDKALEIINKSLSLGGDDSWEIVDHKGDILWQLNRSEEAVTFWKSAIDIGGPTEDIQPKIEGRDKP